MKHLYLNLKRFDVPVEYGGVNRIAPVGEWGRYIVTQTQEALKQYDPAEVEFVQYFPEAHILGAVGALCESSPVQVGSQGVNNGGSSKFTAQLTLERREDMLEGMSAQAEILLDTAENVLTVPVAALVEDGIKTVVYTGYDRDAGALTDPVEVEVGQSDGENAQILSGLEEGDTVYYAYYDTLTE